MAAGRIAWKSLTTVYGLQKKTALVTGSTSGIGLGVAECLASRGCNLVLTGFGNEADIKNIQDNISKTYNVKSDFVDGDLSKHDSIKSMLVKIDELYPDGVDILINNAGLQHVTPVESFTKDKWDTMIAVMLTAPFLLTQHFLPRMRKLGWGRIVNLASVHGLVASPNKATYVSAKHGVLGLTKVVALETAGSGITCNAVCPGFVDTPIFGGQTAATAKAEGISHAEAQRRILEQVHPTLQPVTVEQVAELVAFVCSSAADQMTGSILPMDGGWMAR